jgi:small subunit ribosomal protein S16
LVKIRLRRVGAKKKPSYRLVVADSRAPRDGAFIEVIGQYNPLTNPATITIDSEKALSWLRQGAQPTATVSRLLLKAGISREAKPPKAAKKPKAAVAKEPEAAEAAAEKPKAAKAAVARKPRAAKAVKKSKPTKAGATKKPRVAKAGATKKSKPAKEKT